MPRHLQDEEDAAAARLEAARLEHRLVRGQVAEPPQPQSQLQQPQSQLQQPQQR